MGRTKCFGSSGAFRNRAHPAYWSFEMAVTVRDALSLGGLQRGEVLAGASGLDREITWVEVLESPGALDWLAPAEVRLPVAFALQHDGSAQPRLVTARAGVV